MEKNSNVSDKIFYDNKFLVPRINSENGEVDQQTIFEYHQDGALI